DIHFFPTRRSSDLKENDTMLNGKSIVAGFIIGGTISAATALLTAPTSGRALRNQVRSQGMEWKQIIEDIIKDGWKLKNKIEKTSKKDEQQINKLTKKIKKNNNKDRMKIKDQIAQTSKEGAALINELTEEMKTSVDEWKNTVEPHQNNIHQYLEEIEASIKDLEEKMNSQNNEA